MPRGFTDAATMSMQKEALRRVREMQRQAQASLERSEAAPTPPQTTHESAFFQRQNRPEQRPSAPDIRLEQNSIPTKSDMPPYQPPQNQKSGSPQDIFSRLFGGKTADLGSLGEMVQNAVSSASQPAAQLLDSFGIDGEKLIILMIMWAVFNEHKDNKLLLMALGYLLL